MLTKFMVDECVDEIVDEMLTRCLTKFVDEIYGLVLRVKNNAYETFVMTSRHFGG